jgi:Ca2+-transporting ATPase
MRRIGQIHAVILSAVIRPPYFAKESIFARGMGRHIVCVGLFMALLSAGVGYGYWRTGHQNWQTMLFTTLTFSQMAHVLAIRSERNSLFQIGLRSNIPLLVSVIFTVALQIGLIYLPFLQESSALPHYQPLI